MDLDCRHAGYITARIDRFIAALLAVIGWLAIAPAPAHAAGHHDAPLVATAALAAAASEPASTSAADPKTATGSTIGWRLEASTSVGRPAATFEPIHFEAGTSVPVDYRLWFGDRRTEVGFGLASASTVILAVRHQVTPYSRLTFDTRVGDSATSPPARSRGLPLGVELESSPLHGLAKGTLLRAQLDLRSSLALRLRGGRLGLYLQVRISGDE